MPKLKMFCNAHAYNERSAKEKLRGVTGPRVSITRVPYEPLTVAPCTLNEVCLHGTFNFWMSFSGEISICVDL